MDKRLHHADGGPHEVITRILKDWTAHAAERRFEMDTRTLFNSLQNYRKILVTGPQRSGTTITSQILAMESGYRYIDEREFNLRDPTLFEQFLRDDQNMVIQCPSMSHLIDQFGSEKNLIIFMHRNPREIMSSQMRIGWKSERHEKKLYRGKVCYLPHLFTPICVLKYLHWHFEQKHKVSHYLNLQYSSLDNHPLWIDKENRSTFKAKQTAPTLVEAQAIE